MADKSKELDVVQKHELSGTEPTHPGPAFTPDVDILETPEAITVLADMPGVSRDRLTIDLHDNLLTLSGRQEQPGIGEASPLITEFRSGTWHRQFTISNAIDSGKIEATLANGVLRLVLPKAESSKPRQIPIKQG